MHLTQFHETRPGRNQRCLRNHPSSSAKTGRPEKFTQAQVIAALEAAAGITAAAARLLRCDPSTIRRYVAAHEEIATALYELVEERLDVAETVLIKAMGNDKNPALQLKAAEFYLLTKGKSRGYTKRTEVTGENGGAIQAKASVTIDLSNSTAEDLAMLEAAALASVKAVSPTEH